MPRRRRGPGLLGTVARTAVIAGTAQTTANAVNRRAQQRATASAPVPPPASTAAPPVAGLGGEVDLVAALSRLAHLRDSGALTEPEFQAAKARILA